MAHLWNLEQTQIYKNWLIRTGHSRHTAWHRLPWAGWETYCNLHSLLQSAPPPHPPFCGFLYWKGKIHFWVPINSKQSQGVLRQLTLWLWSWNKRSINEANRGPKKKNFSSFLPSLLLVTGMLWTVRSLKQELVRTCSSTELKTQDWRSEKHRPTTFSKSF